MANLIVPVSAHDHIWGPVNAPLTLVQYGDFQCPHCAAAYPELEAIANELSDSLRFVFRHFPLTQVHPHAQRAAEAAEAAASQGRFWEMAPLLYENQEQGGHLPETALTGGCFGGLGGALGVRMDLGEGKMAEHEPERVAELIRNRLQLRIGRRAVGTLEVSVLHQCEGSIH